MVGGGPLFDETQALITELGLKEKITLTGVLKPAEIRELMKTAGYKILTVQKTYNHFPFSYLVQRIMNFDSIRYPAIDVTLRLKLGNIIAVASPLN